MVNQPVITEFSFEKPKVVIKKEDAKDPLMSSSKKITVVEEQIVIHRLPYMKMKPQVIKNINRVLFFIVFLLTFHSPALGMFTKILGAHIVPFNLFIYPGYFFYLANKERLRRGCRNYCLEGRTMSEDSDVEPRGSGTPNDRDDIFDKINHTKKVVQMECQDKYRFWNFSKKSKFGIVYLGFGCIVLVALMVLEVYDVLIQTNPCLFYFFNPPCQNGKVMN